MQDSSPICSLGANWPGNQHRKVGGTVPHMQELKTGQEPDPRWVNRPLEVKTRTLQCFWVENRRLGQLDLRASHLLAPPVPSDRSNRTRLAPGRPSCSRAQRASVHSPTSPRVSHRLAPPPALWIAIRRRVSTPIWACPVSPHRWPDRAEPPHGLAAPAAPARGVRVQPGPATWRSQIGAEEAERIAIRGWLAPPIVVRQVSPPDRFPPRRRTV